MTKLFEKTKINGMTLSNRFIRSATWEGMAKNDGSVTPKLIQTMVDLAEGGVGLIITGHAYVRVEGQAGPWQMGIYKDKLVDGLKNMCRAVHKSNGKIIAQLAHAGHFAIDSTTSKQAPSVVSNFSGLANTPRHELTKKDIQNIVYSFAQAARRAKESEFDGVQIHSAHGYLLSQFLSPTYNRRNDEYGGAIKNRIRIHLEIYNAIRDIVGKEYPIIIKINSEDCIENGLTLKDSVAAAKIFVNAGIDAIELSGGTSISGKLSPTRSGINKESKEAYFRKAALVYKKEINIPLILVGGIRSLNVAETAINEGIADYISMCRPFICEPNLIKRWKIGDTNLSKCKSDNLCFGPAMKGKGIFCVVKENKKNSKHIQKLIYNV